MLKHVPGRLGDFALEDSANVLVLIESLDAWRWLQAKGF